MIDIRKRCATHDRGGQVAAGPPAKRTERGRFHYAQARRSETDGDHVQRAGWRASLTPQGRMRTPAHPSSERTLHEHSHVLAWGHFAQADTAHAGLDLRTAVATGSVVLSERALIREIEGAHNTPT
jgi:hypothetical protein